MRRREFVAALGAAAGTWPTRRAVFAATFCPTPQLGLRLASVSRLENEDCPTLRSREHLTRHEAIRAGSCVPRSAGRPLLPADSIHEKAGSGRTERNRRLAILTVWRVRAWHVSLIFYHAALMV